MKQYHICILLGRGEVVGFRIHEVTGIEVVDGHRDREGLVCGNGSTIRGENKLGTRHLVLGRNDTHRRRVAGASNDLRSVGEGEVGHSGAKVDEVVTRR